MAFTGTADNVGYGGTGLHGERIKSGDYERYIVYLVAETEVVGSNACP
jgi:hypothetical protein